MLIQSVRAGTQFDRYTYLFLGLDKLMIVGMCVSSVVFTFVYWLPTVMPHTQWAIAFNVLVCFAEVSVTGHEGTLELITQTRRT